MQTSLFRRAAAGLLVVALLLCWLPTPSHGADVTIYNGNQFSPFQGRTQEEIGQRYAQALDAPKAVADYNPDSAYLQAPSLSDPYSAGQLTQATHTGMTAMVNYYRWLIGEEPLQVVSAHSDSLQAGALVRNWEFNHSISDSSKPEDMSDELWNLGKNASHNILAWGYTPVGAITGWLNEGYSLSSQSWDTLGHRYALLAPTYSSVQFGYAGRIAIGKIAAYNNPGLTMPFTAFPAPGYMPSNILSARAAAWDIRLNTDYVRVSSADEVTVRVTELSTGESYDCTKANGKLSAGTSTLAFVQPAPSDGGYTYTPGSQYRVEVFGLTDAQSGNAAQLQYTVTMFDVAQYTPTTVKQAGADVPYSSFNIYTGNATTENLQMLASALPASVAVTGMTGLTVTVPVVGAWQVDQENQCFYAQGDASQLPALLSDPEGVLSRVEIPYTLSTGGYAYGRITLPAQAYVGQSAEVKIYRYMLSTNNSQVFQVAEGKTVMRFSRDTSDWVDSSPYDIYTFSALTPADSGVYFGLYFNSSTAYVTNFSTMTVTAPKVTGVTISALPDKQTYIEGQALDLTGGAILVTYDNGETQTLPMTSAAVSGYDPTLTGTQNITLTYGELSTSFTVTVQAKALVSLAITHLPDKTAYHEDELFSADGLIVTAYYDNDTSAPVTGYALTGYSQTPGEKTVTASLEGKSASFTVTVSAHSYDQQVQPPTCTAQGYTTHTCTLCGKSYTDSYTDPLGHDLGPWTVSTPPTCTEGGEESRSCLRCDLTQTRPLAALGHSWDEGVTQSASTCGDADVTLYTCTRCGQTQLVAGSIAGHTPVTDPGIPATCTEDGLTEGSHCQVCGAVLTPQEILPATGHSYVLSAQTPATCTEDGQAQYTCTLCTHSYQEILPATGHQIVEDPPVAPTCSLPGLTAGSHCQVCGLVLTAQQEIPATDCPSAHLTDVEQGWYHDAVDYMVAGGYMNGISSAQFGIGGTLTRAMLVTILYRLSGSPAVTGDNPFTDVPEGTWYTTAIIWAYENDVVKGVGGGKFAPEAPITREQIATILYRYAQAEPEENDALSSYPDKDQVGGYAVEAMGWAVSNKLINGAVSPTGTLVLDPTNTAKREQCAVILHRYLTVYGA